MTILSVSGGPACGGELQRGGNPPVDNLILWPDSRILSPGGVVVAIDCFLRFAGEFCFIRSGIAQ